MAGLGYVIGGALSGYGKGLATRAEMDAEERRQIALENLRSGNRMAEDENQYNLMDQNNARQVKRTTDSNIIQASHDASITQKRDERQQGFAKELKQIDFANDKELARVRSALGKDEAQFTRDLQKGDIEDVVETRDGTFAIFRKDGSIQRTNVQAAERNTGNGGSALDRARGGGQGPVASAPKPSAATAPKRPEASKSYTQADAAHTAKTHNMTVDQVHKRMRELGYKLATD